MHIGIGIYEGKEIKDPESWGGVSTRALTIKEEIFTIIGTRISEAAVLDIEDENGIYGIEALSRGAAYCRFINYEKNEAKLVSSNLKVVGLDPRDLVVNQQIKEFLEKPLLNEYAIETYDVIFFAATTPKDFEILPELIKKQKTAGLTILIHPCSEELDKIELSKDIQVAETREFEDKKVKVLIKA